MEAEIQRMNQTLDMLKYKYWYYDTAMQCGNESAVSAMIPDQMPEEIRRAYENAHRD